MLAARNTGVVFRGLLLLLSVLALAAPAAFAQGDEVIVDPGSPTGKEYALPVDSARKQAAPHAPTRSSKAQAAPLFGEGVGDGSGTTKASRGARSARRADDGGGNPGSAAGTGASGSPPVHAGTAALRAQAAAPDGGIGLAEVIGASVGVLAIGAAIGLLLRRRSSRAA